MDRPVSPSLPAARSPWLNNLCAEHVRTHGADLITVCSTPNGVSSYVVEGAVGFDLRHDNGCLVTRTVTVDYGTVLAVLGGPAVVECALHDTSSQRDAYRAAVLEVDRENRAELLGAVEAMVVSVTGRVLSELGVGEDSQGEEQG